MRVRTAILLCPLLLLALADLAPGQLGPCWKARNLARPPAPCKPTCLVHCSDPCRRILWADGACEERTGPCTEVQVAVDRYTCRDCQCPFGGGTCHDAGLYPSGSRTIQDC